MSFLCHPGSTPWKIGLFLWAQSRHRLSDIMVAADPAKLRGEIIGYRFATAKTWNALWGKTASIFSRMPRLEFIIDPFSQRSLPEEGQQLTVHDFRVRP